MTTVLLVRHGETAWNRARRLQGWAPVPLSETGRRQARRLGAGLAERYAVDAVTASDLRRARETADLVAEAVGNHVSEDAAWRERDFGRLQGLTYDALDERHPEYSLSQAGEAAIDATPPGGESLADLRARAIGAWDRLLETAGTDETCLVVTHGGPIYLVIGHLTGRPIVEAVLGTSQANCAVNEVHVRSNDAELVRENETGLWADPSTD